MIRRAALFTVFSVALVTVLLVLFEGFASTLRVAREIATTKPVAERRYTTYDPDLGWVSVPNTFIPDMYGAGRALRINAQGFRGNEPVTRWVPPGKVRVICSGDSFTFGYGVDNDHGWCQQLAALDARMQTVNMGQSGYGVDASHRGHVPPAQPDGEGHHGGSAEPPAPASSAGGEGGEGRGGRVPRGACGEAGVVSKLNICSTVIPSARASWRVFSLWASSSTAWRRWSST